MQQLPFDHLERVEAWGGAAGSMAHVFRPSTVDDLRALFKMARDYDKTIGFRGGGNSYGDAFANREQMVLDLTRLRRVLDWQPAEGIIRVEPGVTIDQLWRYILQDGWWPPIVTGTAKTTVGGCAGMNTHGKNAWKMGTFGDHILEFDLMIPSGEIITCSRDENSHLFYAAIGGFGMLGCFTAITMQMKRIYAGYLHVEAASRPNLESALQYLEDHMDNADYLVGWVDALSRGRALGRAEMHRGWYFQPGEDKYPAQTLQVAHQAVADSYFGILPKSSMWFYMRPFMNNLGARLINTAKYAASKMLSGEEGKIYPQTHVAYHFLLDYIPDWKRAYGPGGLIQYQAFIPKRNAAAAFRDILELGQRHRLPNYLSVIKRHKPDDFLISYGVDGFSLAMDFRVTNRNRNRLQQLAREMDEVVLRSDGRFYLAKDSTLRPETARAYLGDERLNRFFDLKRRYDPHGRLQTDMWRRVFAPLAAEMGRSSDE